MRPIERVAKLRAFNRFYTKRIGVLSPRFLSSTFSLTEVRILFELAYRTGVTAQELDPRFANPAAYGDLLAALLALLAIVALRRDWRAAIPLVWIFNVEGTLDLLNAVVQGLRYTEDGMLGATYFIPTVVVPALLVSHVMVFVILLRGEPNTT